jgi:acetolactate synthase regulatory subunit
MSAIAIAPLPPAAAACRPRRVALETTGRDEVLVRVLTVLRRRGCRIVAVDFHEGDLHRPERFELAIEAPTRIEQALESWLVGLVDVLAVHAD